MRERRSTGFFGQQFQSTNQIGYLEQLIIRRLDLSKFHIIEKCIKKCCENFCKFYLPVIVVHNDFIKAFKVFSVIS